MSSKIEICNMALGFLGEPPIADLDEKRPAAAYCKLYYRPALEKVLREHPWNFAQARERLAPVSIPSGWEREYRFAYAHPHKCIALHYLIHPDGYPDRRFCLGTYNGYTVVLADIQDAIASFTTLIEESSVYDSGFRMLLARQLQCLLLKPLLKNNHNLLREAEEIYRNELEAARVLDAREGRTSREDGSIWDGGHDLWVTELGRNFSGLRW